MKKKKNQDRKNRYAELNRQMKIYIHCRLTARGKEQQEKQRNKCIKNIIGLKKLKIKLKKREKKKMEKKEKRGEKKENSTELPKSNIEAEVYYNKKCD